MRLVVITVVVGDTSCVVEAGDVVASTGRVVSMAVVEVKTSFAVVDEGLLSVVVSSGLSQATIAHTTSISNKSDKIFFIMISVFSFEMKIITNPFFEIL